MLKNLIWWGGNSPGELFECLCKKHCNIYLVLDQAANVFLLKVLQNVQSKHRIQWNGAVILYYI